MTLRTVRLAACMAVVGASTSMASIVGSSYSFSTSVTGNTQILAVNGNYTDPANPGFCVGPPLACGLGSGLSGSFLFADSTPTTSTIKFTFFGSTSGAGPGSFSINLSNLTGGDPITSITHGSGNLVGGEFTSVTWDGSHAVFTGSTFGDYIALGGAEVIFNVTTVPEPSSVLLIGTAIALLACRRKRRLA